VKYAFCWNYWPGPAVALALALRDGALAFALEPVTLLTSLPVGHWKMYRANRLHKTTPMNAIGRDADRIITAVGRARSRRLADTACPAADHVIAFLTHYQRSMLGRCSRWNCMQSANDVSDKTNCNDSHCYVKSC